jgi:hypothetical protein
VTATDKKRLEDELAEEFNAVEATARSLTLRLLVSFGLCLFLNRRSLAMS